MKYCPNCNFSAEDEAKFCNNCGKQFEAITLEPTSEIPQADNVIQSHSSAASDAVQTSVGFSSPDNVKMPERKKNKGVLAVIIVLITLVVGAAAFVMVEGFDLLGDKDFGLFSFTGESASEENGTEEDKSEEDKSDEDKPEEDNSEADKTEEDSTEAPSSEEEQSEGDNTGRTDSDVYVLEDLGLCLEIPEDMVIAENEELDDRLKEFIAIETSDGSCGIGLCVYDLGKKVDGIEKEFINMMSDNMTSVYDFYGADYELNEFSGFEYAGKTFERIDLLVKDIPPTAEDLELTNMSMWFCCIEDSGLMVMIYNNDSTDFDDMAALFKTYP